MFGPDPIDIYDPSPYWPIAYYGHYVIGTCVLLAALSAFWVQKGRGVHRTFGLVFIGGVCLLGFTTISMLSDRFIPPLAMAALLSYYTIAGAYLALQRGSKWVRAGEIALTVVLALALAGWTVGSAGAVKQGLVPLYGPIVIGIIPAILLVGDANWHLRQKSRQHLRVRRHLSRMVWAFVVVLRAPLVELAAAGAPLTEPMVIFGPIALGLAMIAYFMHRIRQGRVGSPLKAP